MELYILRHGESEGNILEITQGPNYNLSLTIKGKLKTNEIAKTLHEKLRGRVDRIITSPRTRAIQTGKIIADTFQKKVEIDASLDEYNPGILEGPKVVANATQPKYFSILERRGDLNGIPGAESGDELQSRVIYFLERYFGSDKDTKEIIVSHAGFNRCLLNTVNGHPRTKPVNHHHNAIHHIETNPWNLLDIKKFESAKASEAFRVKTSDQVYVMKRIYNTYEKKMKFQESTSNHVAKGGELLSQVLYGGMKVDHAVQILKYIPGDHKYDALSEIETRRVIESVHELGQRLKTVPKEIGSLCDSNLNDKIKNCVYSISNSPIQKIGRSLLENERYSYLVAEKNQVLVHYDFHRSNLVFTPEHDVKILDLGSMLYAPSEFLPASLFMSSFLLQQPDEFKLNDLISKWPEKLNAKNIKILMQARAIIGGAFFQQSISKNPDPEDIELYNKYLKSLYLIEGLIGEENGSYSHF